MVRLMADTNPMLANYLARHEAGDLEGAERGYLDVLRSDPGDATALYLLGTLNAQQKNYSAAIDLLQRSLQAKPDDAHVTFNLGNVFAESGNISGAIDCFRRVLHLDPRMVHAGLILGRILHSKQDYSDAADAFRTVLAVNPANADVLVLLGRTLMFEGKLDESAGMIQRSLQIQPGLAVAHATAGDILTRQEKYRDADVFYKRANELDSRDASICWRWGDMLRTQGRMGEARDKYSQAVLIEPDNIHCQARYGMALLVAGPPEKQSVLSRLAQDHVYDDISEATRLARELAQHYDYNDAASAEVLLRVLEQFNPGELYTTAWWNAVLGDFGSPVLAHDRILRGVMSAVFSWSIPTREVIEAIAQFAGGARLNSLGAGTGYWELLLAQHFGVQVRATDLTLKHRFIPMEPGEYATAQIDAADVVFLAWVPEGVEDAQRVLERIVRGQRLVLVGEPPDEFGVAQTCGTSSFHALLTTQFKLVDTIAPARFNYFRDSVNLYIKEVHA